MMSCVLIDLSGPCMTLVLTKGDTGEGVVNDVRSLIGPPDVEQAKQESPERQASNLWTP